MLVQLKDKDNKVLLRVESPETWIMWSIDLSTLGFSMSFKQNDKTLDPLSFQRLQGTSLFLDDTLQGIVGSNVILTLGVDNKNLWNLRII
jgi:hypothetical protein